MTLAEIKNAIEGLPEKERCELNAWMQNWTPDEWDRQLETDVQAGKLDALAVEGEDAFRRGELVRSLQNQGQAGRAANSLRSIHDRL